DNTNTTKNNPDGANKQFDLYTTTVTVGDKPKGGGTEGQALNAVPLGTFTDPGGFGPYSISVDWGDGTPLDTTSGYVTTSGTTLTVRGTHTWSKSGVYDAVATVTRGSYSLTLRPSFQVDETALTVSATSVSGSAWTALSNVQVATFTDADTT